jgi:kumamolisin
MKQITVVLRPRQVLPSLAELSLRRPASQSREEIERAHSADPAHIEKVQDFARAHGLQVVESSADRRSVVLSGPDDRIRAAFGTDPSQIPPELRDIALAVLGISDRPIARPR